MKITNKKIAKAIMMIVLSIAAYNQAYSQFTTYTPPSVFSITDLDILSSTGKLVVATLNDGAYVFDGTTWTQYNTASGLPSNDVKCLATTSIGEIFVGTASGISIFNGTIWNNYTLNTTQTFGYISAILVRPGIDTLYGTDNGKYLQKTSATTATNIVFSPAIGLVTDIKHIDPPGIYDFLMATSINQAVIYDPGGPFTFIVNTTSTPIPSNNILSHDSEGNKSFDGTDNGVYIPDFTNFPNMIDIIYNTTNSPLPSNIIKAIAVKNGIEWYGTPNGLTRHQGTNWITYNTTNSNLPDNDVVELAIDTISNIVWIGTANGNVSKIGLTATGINESAFTNRTLIAYPNPASGFITIEIPSPLKAIKSLLLIKDILGKEILKTETQGNNILISTENLKSGLYFYYLESENEKLTPVGKLIITK